MTAPDRLIRSIADTAQWAALYRAQETERKNALFRDPFARRLAGERGAEIARSMGKRNQNEWAWVTRTFLFDRLITESIARGTNLVVNLAAGLDARPYRMELPAALSWVEIDMPELLAYKESILKHDKPRCSLERVPLDLADVPARQALFQRLGHAGTRGLIISEGFLIYLSAGMWEPWRRTRRLLRASGSGPSTCPLPGCSTCSTRPSGKS
jgi:methyltransferase (TIGR00027 family)